MGAVQHFVYRICFDYGVYMGDDKVIEAIDIKYIYPDGTLAIEHVHFELFKGERVAIIGPNGSGKSTLLKILSGLIKPTSGIIKFYGKEKVKEEEIRRKLGILLQNPDDVLFNSTVAEDLEFAPAQLEISQERFKKILDEIIDLLDMENFLDKPPFRLSEGQKQRAAFASIITMMPEVIFLDEPFSSLDCIAKEKIIDYLDEMNKKGASIVTVLHDLHYVPFVADRIYMLNKKIVAEGKTRDILGNADVLTENGMDVLPAIKIGIELQLNPLPVTIEELIEKLNTTGTYLKEN